MSAVKRIVVNHTVKNMWRRTNLLKTAVPIDKVNTIHSEGGMNVSPKSHGNPSDNYRYIFILEGPTSTPASPSSGSRPKHGYKSLFSDIALEFVNVCGRSNLMFNQKNIKSFFLIKTCRLN